MRPDLASLFAGTNDAVSRRFDPVTFESDFLCIQRALIGQGATVVSFTLPDLRNVLPFGGWLSPRVEALNEAIRRSSRASGAVLVDFAAHAVASDLRLWSADRFHANATGHALIAHALAHAIGVAGADDSWQRPFGSDAVQLPGESPARWVVRHLIPWAWRHARGRSSGDGRLAKRPDLMPVQVQRQP